eukprot:gene29330-38409_t
MVALIDAAKRGDVNEVKRLINGGANVNQEDDTDESTALHAASSSGHAEVVDILLKAGAKVDAEDKERNTPLHNAAANGRADVASLLLKAKADVNGDYWSVRTPLMQAARHGRPETVPILLAAGAFIDFNFEGKTALDMARGPPSDTPRGPGHDDVATLLQAWMDEKLPLYYAAKAGDAEKVKRLIDEGADVAQRGDYGWTPLHRAAGSGHGAVASILLAAGAEVDNKDNYGMTPLHRAAGNGHGAVASILLAAGAEVDNKTNDGRTALNLAALRGYADMTSILLAAGAEVDAADKDGDTPLGNIARTGKDAAVPLLLAAGADIEIRNKEKKSVMDRAKQYGRNEMVKLLEEWSSKTSKAKAVNDSSKGGIDRLGYDYYAHALFKVLSQCDTPLCVGLYGRWGSGKSFLVELLKRAFDKDVSPSEITKELLQRFEDEENPKQTLLDTLQDLCWKLIKEIQSNIMDFMGMFMFLVAVFFCDNFEFVYRADIQLIFVLIHWDYGLWFLQNILRSICLPYVFDTHFELLNDFLTDLAEFWMLQDSKKPLINKRKKETVEYVFVDFNAWEFCASQELWAGMIQGIYDKIEQRFEYEARRKGGSREDFKKKWRTKTAKEELTKVYGGKAKLEFFVVLASVSIIFLFVALVWYLRNIIELPGKDQYEKYVYPALSSFVSYIWGKSIFQSAQVSRGDEILSKADAAEDKIGLMRDVREQLSSLFKFINEDFKDGTSIQLKLVLFIDDLDRCLEGRNVKMLEAVHLLLNVPGAPVITFLAIDSRVVVASIEEHIGDGEGLPTGGEYLRKIVQITFCIPEVTDERIRRYVQNIVKKNITIDAISNMILLLKAHYKTLSSQIQNATNFPNRSFELWCRFPKTNFVGLWIGGTCMKAQLLFEAIEESDIWESLKKLTGKLNFGRGVNGKSVFAVYGELEGKEVFLQQAEQLFKKAEFFCSNAITIPEDTEQTTKRTEKILPELKQPIQEIEWGTIKDEKLKDSYIDAHHAQVISIPDKHKSVQFGDMDSKSVLPDNICQVLDEVVKLVNCNPRDMKRVINLLQIVFVLGNIKPRDCPIAFSKDKERWNSFLEKSVLWIVLCQNFPYRMSLLVQLLLDFDQKQNFNTKNSMKLLTNTLFSYRNSSAENSQPELDEEMTIYEFYMIYVDKFVKAFKKSDRFCRLDNDPEEFAALLQHSARDDEEATAVKCADVLGPIEKSEDSTPSVEEINAPELKPDSESNTADGSNAVDSTAPASPPAAQSDSTTDSNKDNTTTTSEVSPKSPSPDDAVEGSPSGTKDDSFSSNMDSVAQSNSDIMNTASKHAGAVSSSLSTIVVSPTQPPVNAVPGVATDFKDPFGNTEGVAKIESSAINAKMVAKRKGERDSTFSLLSYSFNLDPAMRIEIGEEIASVVSDFELYEEANGKPISLQRGAVPRKIDILTAVSNDDDTYNYNPTVHGASKARTNKPQSEEEIEKSITEAIQLISAKGPIVAWLKEQCLLSKEFLLDIDPLNQCPKEWPLGWKLALKKAIEELKSQ